MKEIPIFRNIQHIPRIWGVTYPKLFACLGAGLLITTLGFFLSSEGTALVKVMVIGLGAITTLSLYAVCLWVDSTDQLEHDTASFLKDEMNSQSLSLQRLQFFDREGVDAVPRSATRH